MKSRNVRFTTALVTFGLFVALAGLIAPSALGATAELRILTQPQDAEVNQTIRTADLNVGSGFVRVEVVDAATGARITNFNKPIGFVLNPAAGFATGNVLDVTPQVPVNGVAEFGVGTLSIDTENEPQFTDYSIIPVTTRGPLVTGAASEGFDVWEDGESCNAGGPTCDAFLRGNDGDHYSLSAGGSLGASELQGVLPGLTCPGQRVVFTNRVFSYATTETDGVADQPVLLHSIITKAEWKAAASNGQAHADWCIGLPTAAPWENNGASYRAVDFNGTAAGGILFVALAPNCPVANPSASAPCIVSQNPLNGGNITIGWLTGGDPPRRT